jgi:hypothetical protein
VQRAVNVVGALCVFAGSALSLFSLLRAQALASIPGCPPGDITRKLTSSLLQGPLETLLVGIMLLLFARSVSAWLRRVVLREPPSRR